MFGEIPASVVFLSMLIFSVLGLIAYYYIKQLDLSQRLHLLSKRKHSSIQSYGSRNDEQVLSHAELNEHQQQCTNFIIDHLDGYRLAVQQYMTQNAKPVLFESNPDTSVSAFNEYPDLYHVAKPIQHAPDFNPVPSPALHSLLNAFYEKNKQRKKDEDRKVILEPITTTYGSVVLDCPNI